MNIMKRFSRLNSKSGWVRVINRLGLVMFRLGQFRVELELVRVGLNWAGSDWDWERS